MINITRIFISIALLFGAVSAANATLIISGDGSEGCLYRSSLVTGSCNVQTISVHNAWQSNDPLGNDARWISYADTGVNGSTLAPTGLAGGTTPLFRVIEQFYANAGDVLTLNVWADDTAEVFINSSSVYLPNFTQSTCANGAIGCEPGENGMISYTFLSTGLQTVLFDVFQVGTGSTNSSNPFGILYSGEVTSSVPEPAILALMGLGLAGLGFNRRKQAR